MIDRIATLRGYIATLLVALWAFQPLVAFVHAQEHAHRFCPEHQTFEETARGAGQLQNMNADSAPTLSAIQVDTGVDSARTVHETCPLLTASTRGDMLATEAVTKLSTPPATSLPATAPPTSRCSVPILATAPKSSPPAHA